MVIHFLDPAVVIVMLWIICPFIFMRIWSNSLLTKYEERMEEFLFHWYITEALLSGRPWIQIRPKKASARDMKKRLQNGLSLKIRTESEARLAAEKLFENVAKPGSEFIDLEDLAPFLPEYDAVAALSFFKGISEDETIQISCSSLQDWMGSTLVDESIRNLCLFCPFYVGERCKINGVELVVKKINFLTTTFVGLDEAEGQFRNSTVKWITRFEGSSRLEKIHLIRR